MELQTPLATKLARPDLETWPKMSQENYFFPWSLDFHFHWEILNLCVLLEWCYGMSYVPPNLYIEVLTPSVAIFGDRAFTDVAKVKLGHKGGE